MLILGLGHKARHGKDSFIEAVLTKYGNTIRIKPKSFADALRKETMDAAKAAFLSSYDYDKLWFDNYECGNEGFRLLCHLKDIEFESKPIIDQQYPWGKQRKLLQWWGTEYRRAQDPQYWVKRTHESVITDYQAGVNAIIFSDMRFINEADYIKSIGGTTIKVTRMGYDNGLGDHPSETQLNDHPVDIELGFKNGRIDLLNLLAPEVFWVLYDSQSLLARETFDPMQEKRIFNWGK